MNTTFGLLFYLKKSKVNSTGNAPIYLRITVEGKRSEISTKRSVNPKHWSSEANKAVGRSQDIRELNAYLDILTSKVYQNYKLLIEDNREVTAETLKNKVLGIDEKERTLLSVFKAHNDQVEKLLGKEFSPGTLERYKTAYKHLENFMQFQYKISDIPLKKINHEFITDLEFYLKTERDCSHNTTIKYIKNFKKIVRIAMAKKWIKYDPFANYKVTLKEVKRDFLSKEEMDRLINKHFHNERLDRVRDIFVFCCYTGLAYIDIKQLSQDQLIKGIDGELWVKTNRQKTESRSHIPLLDIPLQIIKKYKNHPEVVTKKVVLPVLSNQKSNAYLKEIADLCQINKNLTTHLARHTFATTITLSNNVPIESVSKMLGHKSIKTTQHYAKILDTKVSADMNNLRTKMANNKADNSIKKIS